MRIRKIFGYGLLAIIVFAVGIFVYANFFVDDEAEGIEYKMPDKSEAQYSLSAGRELLLLTNSYEQFGDKAGERIYVLQGYWELRGNEFVYRSHDIIISEQTYGTITVKRR